MNQSDVLTRKSEINLLLKHLEATPWPEGIEEARIHYDALGTPAAKDINIEKLYINNKLPAQILTPPNYDTERILIYLHGGGFVFGSLVSHEGMVAEIARAAKCKALQLDYRRAPEHPFPAPIEDTCAAYEWLLNQGYSPNKISIAGDSAGGGLVITALLAIRGQGKHLPGAAVCISPWVDLEFTGESHKSRKHIDPLVQEEVCNLVAKSYLNNHDPKDPLVSPIYADLKGLPPILIQVGEREILYNDALMLLNCAQKYGVEVEFEEWLDMVHVWHFYFMLLQDGRNAIKRIGNFLISKTGSR